MPTNYAPLVFVARGPHLSSQRGLIPLMTARKIRKEIAAGVAIVAFALAIGVGIRLIFGT